MAHLRKKERWLDHARAMIEGKSLAKTAQLCGVHPTTAFRWRHRFLRAPASDKPRMLKRDRRSRRDLRPRNPSRAAGPTCRARRASEAERQGIRAFIRTTFPFLVARDRKGATFDAVLPQVDGASVESALAGLVHAGQSSHRRRRPRRSPPSPAEPGFRSTPCRPRESRPRGASPPHQ